MGVERETAKTIFLSLTNGGIKAYHNAKNKTKFLSGYKTELIGLHKQFAEHPDHHDRFLLRREQRKASGKDYNHEASYMNTLLCDMENTC